MARRRALSGLETAFIAVDRAGAPLHIGSVSILEGAPLHDDGGGFRLDDLRDLVRSRLPQLPHLAWRLRWPPGGVGRPWWEDDPDFDVRRHVTLTVLAGGTEADLRRFAADRFATSLPTDRPLWSLDFVTGLPDRRVAVVQRVHHALVDGVSGVDLATLLFGVEPCERVVLHADDPRDPVAPAEPDGGVAEPLRWVTAGVGDVLRVATSAIRAPLATAREVGTLARGLRAVTTGGATAPPCSLNAPVGSHRRLLWIRARLDAVKAVAQEHDVKVNDVILSAVAGGIRELLITRGEPVAPGAFVRTLVPVSHHHGTPAEGLGNRVGSLLADLPIGIGDPAARLRAVGAETARLKVSGEDELSEVVVALTDVLPAAAIASAARLLDHQPLVNVVVTNVPGPPFPLYALDAQLLEAFPFVPLAGNLALGVAVLSYAGAIDLGVTVDPDLVPDADAFAAGVERALAQLGAADAAAPEPLPTR
jgi:WS/DGAT/MGAT family acyltransferase